MRLLRTFVLTQIAALFAVSGTARAMTFIGAIHDLRLSDDIKLGGGALINGFDIPSPLSASYGDTGGGMVFVRLKIG